MFLRNMGLNWSKALGIALASTVGLYGNSSVAQITPDQTLPTNSNVTSEGNIRTITGGTQAGGNLFHSFREFSIPTNVEAFFNNGADIQNIINRVTGGSVSNIDGLLRANGGANLFLINPNGIVFGPNARLNIGGSFYGTSANSMKFADGSEFSAVNPQSPPLLTINVPLGLQYGTNPGNITVGNEGQNEPTADSPTLLEVPTGETLALLGGDVNVNGQRLRAPGGRIELGGLASGGTVGINNDGSLTFPDGVTRADVSLNGGQVDVTAGGGGSISINARNINLLGGSDICAGIGGGGFCGRLASDTTGSVESQAGDITLNATQDITGSGGVVISNHVNSGATGNSGNINIGARSLSMTNGAALSASTFGQGDAGSININVNDSVKLDGSDSDGFSTGVVSAVGAGAVGNAGNLSISTASLELSNSAQLNTIALGKGNGGDIFISTGSLEVLNGALVRGSTFGEGDAGSIIINANDLVKFDGEGKNGNNSGVFSQVEPNAVGNGGGVSITTGSLEVLNGAQLTASTFGEGNAGSININADDLVKFDGRDAEGNSSGAFSIVESDAVGNGRGVSITTGSLEVLNGAQISTSTFGRGNAGSVTIKANDLVNFDREDADGSDTGALSSVGSNAVGNAGGVSITTGYLEVLNGAQISASTFGEGDGGSVTIKADDLVKLDSSDADGNNSGVFSTVGSDAVGNAGGVSITTGSLEVLNGAQITASTFGQGNAGSVTINANDLVKFDGSDADGNGSRALSQVEPNAVGNAEGISISTGSLEILNGAQLSASTAGQGDAGSVTINANDLVKFDGSDEDGTSSGAFSVVVPGAVGNAGGVLITTGSLEIFNGAQVSASTAGQGDAGSVTINANDLVKFDGKDEDGSVSAVSSAVAFGAVGDGGGVSIKTDELQVTNRAVVTVLSSGQGNAGEIDIDAKSIRLDNTRIVADTQSAGEDSQANISIRSQDLILRRGSNSTADARGNGGNITINTGVLAGYENSNITANSTDAQGGNVIINAEGVFGMQFREEDSLLTSDITATGANSDLSGNVEVDTTESDPTRGLAQVPPNTVDPSNQIYDPCTPGNPGFGSSFVSVGRGGLPMTPTEPLQDTSTISTWVRLKPRSPSGTNRNTTNIKTTNRKTSSQPTTTAKAPKVEKPTEAEQPTQIVEATGWIVNAQGNIEFVAQANHTNPTSPWQNPASCSVSSEKEEGRRKK